MQNQEKIIQAIAEYLEWQTDVKCGEYGRCERVEFGGALNPAGFTHAGFCKEIAEEILTAIAPHLEAGAGWEDAPEWANYLAMDANGYWWWYEEKPQLSRGIWAFGGERSRKTLHKQDVAWNESLQERPK